MSPSLSIILRALFYISVGTQAVYLNQRRYNEYDYIIVGAGSTGSVVASRLSEDPRTKVLLLEAGGPPDDVSEVPLFAPNLEGGPMDWGYLTEPEEKARLAFETKNTYLPRGKVLGGSSVLNYMIYIRGLPRDFDEWAKDGATGWAWKDVLPYFKKSQDQTDPELLASGYHSHGGPLTVSSATFATAFGDAFLEGGKYLGYNVLKDLNADDVIGFARSQSTTRNGLRCSTEKAFLRPAAHRANFDVLIHAHVTKINFDPDSKRAVSVSFLRDNASVTVPVHKEVILSAGAIASPQILMLSGIGPKEHLRELGIPVLSDLPVGGNLQDHTMAGGLLYLLNSSSGLAQLRELTRESVGALVKGKGPLTVPGYSEGVAFVTTKYQEAAEGWPDLMIFPLSTLVLPPVKKQVSDFLSQFRDQDVVTVYPTLARPKSRGLIKLRSKNPLDQPLIYARLLDHEEDFKTLVEGMKIVEALMHSPPLQRLGASRIQIKNIGCDFDGDQYLECLARALTMNMFHKSSTCKMGDPLDHSTVLDPQLRVKGVKGLRVADLSIMPTITSGNTNAPCIMIGEKAADMIKKTNHIKEDL